MSAPEHTATAQQTCTACGRKIDVGDRYTIVKWKGGFDHQHVDCDDTSMQNHLRTKKGS